jgi:hypothetical protein
MLTKARTLIIAITSLTIGYIFIHPLQFGICKDIYSFGGAVRCSDKFLPSAGDFLVQISIVVLLLVGVLYFLREEIFRAWIRFARWWVPLSLVLILAAPTSSHSWAIGGFDREGVTWLMDGLFLIISLILIIKKSVQLRGK